MRRDLLLFCGNALRRSAKLCSTIFALPGLSLPQSRTRLVLQQFLRRRALKRFRWKRRRVCIGHYGRSDIGFGLPEEAATLMYAAALMFFVNADASHHSKGQRMKARTYAEPTRTKAQMEPNNAARHRRDWSDTRAALLYSEA